jgi:hypothetical protein
MPRAPSAALAMFWPAIPTSKKLAAFYAINLLAAKSLSGVVELSTTHLRKQFDAPTKQSNDHREAPKAAAAGDQLALAEQYAPVPAIGRYRLTTPDLRRTNSFAISKATTKATRCAA